MVPARFAVIFGSGILLFIAQAEKVYPNTLFRFKLAFLLLAGINAEVFQVMFYPK